MTRTFSPSTRLYTWGVTVTLAYVLSQLAQSLDMGGHASITWMWGLLMLPPLVMEVMIWPKKEVSPEVRQQDALGAGWGLLVILGMLVTVAALASGDHEFEHFAYRTLWFVVAAVGFTHTALVEHKIKSATYATAAVLNAVAALMMFFDYETMEPIAFGLAALIQGVPILVHARSVAQA